MREPALVEAIDVEKTYRRGELRVRALRDANLRVWPGELMVVLGPSGSGKSTLLHLLGGVDQPTSGQLRVGDTRLDAATEATLTRYRREQIGFIFQFYNLIPSLNALDNAALPLLARGESWGGARQKAAAWLERVGMDQRLRHRPAELSGGEQQRVAIARALVGRPALVLADEPTGDLDSRAGAAVAGLMLELNRDTGVTFVIATHNPALFDAAGRVLEMRDGCPLESRA